MFHCLVPALLVILSSAASPALAQSWAERKCTLFADAWVFAAPTDVPDGASAPFRAEVEGFIASGCSGPRRACPVTDADRELADMLSLMAVAEGMAGSFLPFSCPLTGDGEDLPDR